MNLPNKRAAELLGKDKFKSEKAASKIINDTDLDAWRCIIDNAEFIFSYIKEKAGRKLAFAINKNNYNNVFEFFKYYAEELDYFLVEPLTKVDIDQVKPKMLELLSAGSVEEKAYAVKYLGLINDTDNAKLIFEQYKESFEPLKVNVAEALSSLEDKESYSLFIEQLKSEDDWEKVDAAQFLSVYGNAEAIKPMLESMSNSDMAENIAGEICSLVNLSELFDGEDKQVQELSLEAFDNILSGIPEVWDVSALLGFKVYDCINKIIELSQDDVSFEGQYALLLLKMKSKAELFVENSQYTFDADKDALKELEEIHNLLNSLGEEFWAMQSENLYEELSCSSLKRKKSAIALIAELKQDAAAEHLLPMLEKETNEILLCEIISAIDKLGQTSKINNIDEVLGKIKDPNLLAISKSSLSLT